MGYILNIFNILVKNKSCQEGIFPFDNFYFLNKFLNINSCINCDIEMQVVDKNDIERRLLFYWSRLFSKSIKAGKDYSKLEKTIAILITDYELESLKKSHNIKQNGK